MRKKPSQKQLATLRFIQRFTDEHGAPPAMQEIADEFDITPPSVYQQIVLLEKRGLIERFGKGKSRGIRVATGAIDKVTPIEEFREIPILGTA